MISESWRNGNKSGWATCMQHVDAKMTLQFRAIRMATGQNKCGLPSGVALLRQHNICREITYMRDTRLKIGGRFLRTREKFLVCSLRKRKMSESALIAKLCSSQLHQSSRRLKRCGKTRI